MELRIYIPMKHVIRSELRYQRTEGGFWFTETVHTRRTFRIHTRTMRHGFLVETLEELDPDFVALPCWPLVVQPFSETILSAAAKVLHIPEFSILCCSLESIHSRAVQEWLTLANISVSDVTNSLHSSDGEFASSEFASSEFASAEFASAEKESRPHPRHVSQPIQTDVPGLVVLNHVLPSPTPNSDLSSSGHRSKYIVVGRLPVRVDKEVV